MSINLPKELPEKQINRMMERIKRAPHALDGYIHGIYYLTREIKPEVIVELGTNVGDSAFAYLCAIEMNQKGHLWTIDISSNDVEALKNDVSSFNWNDKIDIINSDSVEYSKSWPPSKKIDLLYIDTNHAYDHTKNELNSWVPILKKDGFLLMDDFFTTDVWKAFFDWVQTDKEILSEIRIAIGQDKILTSPHHTLLIARKYKE